MTDVVLAVTIDTEADHSVSWAKSSPLTFHSVTEGIPNLLTPLFDRYGVRPTYLLTSEVLENDECVRTLKDLPGEFELGTHLHPEYVEPLRKLDHYEGTRSNDFIAHYPAEVQLAKLENITRLFERRFGYSPRSFRAGRFGANSETLAALAKLGYLVDTSVTPYIKWRNSSGVVDFTHAPEQPYFPDHRDLARQGSIDVLEIPVSIALNAVTALLWKTEWGIDVTRMRGVRRFCQPASIWPSFFSAERMNWVARKIVERYKHREVVVLNMMLHSMEIIPLASPYVRTEEESRLFLERMGSVFAFCKQAGGRFETLSGVPRTYG